MEDRRKILKDFLTEFPLETLSDMPLDKYTNLNRSDSFCYWVESRTYDLGSIWGGSSYKNHDGNIFMVKTLDLRQDFKKIEEQLEAIPGYL